MSLFCIVFSVGCGISYEKSQPENSMYFGNGTGLGKYFYKLVKCEKQLCVKSIIKAPSDVDTEKELKKFDSVKIQHCSLQEVPKLSTAKCQDIGEFKSKARSAQLSLIELERQYLKEDSSRLLDEAVEMMSSFVNKSTSCTTSGFLDTYYGLNGKEEIGNYQRHYSAVLEQIVPFINVVLNSEGSTSRTAKENGSEGLELVETADVSENVTARDRIDTKSNYTLEVMKFEPKLTVGIDFSWPDAENISIGNFSDAHDSVKELIELGKHDNKSFEKVLKAAVWAGEVAKDFWSDYPLKLASQSGHVGVAFGPRGIYTTAEQAISMLKKDGQIARVEHPNIDPVKYLWQIFHGHTIGSLGAASIAIGDIRKAANATLGVYTSLAFVVRKGGKDGPIIDSFVYPYTKKDHGLLTLDELKQLYKGNFVSVEGSKSFTGQEYIDFLDSHKEQHLDEVLQAKRLRNNYLGRITDQVDSIFPKAEDLDKGIKISEAQRQSYERLKAENAEIRAKLFNKINGYVVAVDSAKDMKVEQKSNIDKVVVLELKKDVLRIAIETLGFESSQYKIIRASTSRELIDFTEEEVNKVFKDISDLKEDKLMSDAELGRHRQTSLYKFRERFSKFKYEEFVQNIASQTEPELNIDKFRKDLLGDDLSLKKAGRYIVDEYMFPLINGYRGIQDLSIDAKLKFQKAIKIQMKYDLLKLAVTEFGYSNKGLEKISTERKYKVFDIFRKENKHELVPDVIESMYNEFINDDHLERFEIPEGKLGREYIEANRAEMAFKNPDLYRYQDYIKKIEFDKFYENINELVELKDSADVKANQIMKKVSPATCETSCQILKLGGYDVDLDELNALTRRKVFTALEVQEGKFSASRILQHATSSISVEVGSDSLDTYSAAKKLYKDTVAPKKIPTIERPSIPKRIKFGRYGLADAASCENFDYGEVILELNSIFLQLRENSIYIDFLDF